MTDDLAFTLTRYTTLDRPMSGLTLLTVDDSRVASEALRLLCRRCGARLRRAESLAAARHHLRVYRPAAILVDLGLPDGSGLGLIRALATAQARIPRIVATSADIALEEAALAAGADAFLAKPCNAARFQAVLLHPLVGAQARMPQGTEPRPDALALRDDLTAAERALTTAEGPEDLDYLAQFLGSVGHTAGDAALCDAAGRLARDRAAGAAPGVALAQIAGLVRERLDGARAL